MELAQASLANGDVLTLRQCGDDFEIRLNLWELMTSRNSLSERALGQLVMGRVDCRAANVLIGGLGMGYTLRSVLDRAGVDSRITVAELVPEVIQWNLGPLAGLAGRPLADPRVRVHEGDVADIVRSSARCFDIILMDVDNGPEAVLFPDNRDLYSGAGVALLSSALKPCGILGVWAADRSPDFEHVLECGEFAFERVDVNVSVGLQHSLYLVPATQRSA